LDHAKQEAAQADCQKSHKTKASLLTAFWRVYSVLLEYTYASDYELQISQVQEANRTKEQEEKARFNEILKDGEQKQQQLREQMKLIQDTLQKT